MLLPLYSTGVCRLQSYYPKHFLASKQDHFSVTRLRIGSDPMTMMTDAAFMGLRPQEDGRGVHYMARNALLIAMRESQTIQSYLLHFLLGKQIGLL
jgi:hypothetical protein